MLAVAAAASAGELPQIFAASRRFSPGRNACGVIGRVEPGGRWPYAVVVVLVGAVSLVALLGGASAPEPVAPTPAPEPPAAAAPASAEALPATRGEKVTVEACDGAQSSSTKNPAMLTCSRWRIEWREGGTPWGFIAADSYAAVVAERDRQLGFARRYARFFEVAVDERYLDPGPPICESCESKAAVGRWGEGQKFGDSAARRAISGAEAELRALDAALVEHAPRLDDAARLARQTEDSKLSRQAKDYGKQLRQGMLDLAKARLSLDNAVVFRSQSKADEVSTMARARIESLATSGDKLAAMVGTAVGKAHGGEYREDGKADAPFLDIKFDGAKVTGTYVVGEAKAIWFEGTVSLDGSISGRSLLAPEGGELTCQKHSEECGYEYIDAVLRFNLKGAEGQEQKEVAELWFRRSKWVMAKPFIR